jgi:hypothetical protein
VIKTLSACPFQSIPNRANRFVRCTSTGGGVPVFFLSRSCFMAATAGTDRCVLGHSNFFQGLRTHSSMNSREMIESGSRIRNLRDLRCRQRTTGSQRRFITIQGEASNLWSPVSAPVSMRCFVCAMTTAGSYLSAITPSKLKLSKKPTTWLAGLVELAQRVSRIF